MAKTYATLNPSDKDAAITLSGGDLTMTSATNAWRSVRATIGKSSWKWYWEITNTTTLNPYWSRGIWKSGATLANVVGYDINGWWWYNDWSSTLKFNNNSSSSYGSLSSSWDVIWFALDMTAWTLECFKNNVSQGIMYSWLTGTIFPMFSIYGAWPSIVANFGATAMTYTAPSWYNQWLYTGSDNSWMMAFFLWA